MRLCGQPCALSGPKHPPKATHLGVGLGLGLACACRRALFLGWLLPAVGVLNVRIAFNHLWPSAITGALQKEHEYLGYDKWLQLELGEALIRKYIQQAKELEGTPRKRLKTNSAPHFMPRHPGPPAPATALIGLPSNHQWVNIIKDPKVQSRHPRALCLPSHREEALVSSLTVLRIRVTSALPAT